MLSSRPGMATAAGTGGGEREFEYKIILGSQPDPFAYERGLTPEEIALTTHIEVPGLPALVIPGGIRDYIDCCVAFIEGPKKFFVQLQSETSKIEELQSKMQIHYQSDRSSQTNTLKGSVVAAKFYQTAGGDDNWYRAVITDRRGPAAIEIFFVDYGNKIEVTKNEIKSLPPEYRTLPAQAIACALWDVSTLDKTTLARFQTSCESQESIIRIEGKTTTQDAYNVTLFRLVDSKEFNMNDALNGRGNYPPVDGEEPAASAAPAQPAAAPAPPVNPFGSADRGGFISASEDRGGFGARGNANEDRGGFGQKAAGEARGGFGGSTGAGASGDRGGFGASASASQDRGGFGERKSFGEQRGFGSGGGGGFGSGGGNTGSPFGGGGGGGTGFGGGRGGGAGFGGDSRSGGGGSNCFNCNKPGHMSRDCTEPRAGGRGGGGSDRNCYNCGEPGHQSRDCTKPRAERGGGGGGDRNCFNCGEPGHQSRDCTKPRQERGGGGGRGGGFGGSGGGFGGSSGGGGFGGGGFGGSRGGGGFGDSSSGGGFGGNKGGFGSGGGGFGASSGGFGGNKGGFGGGGGTTSTSGFGASSGGFGSGGGAPPAKKANDDDGWGDTSAATTAQSTKVEDDDGWGGPQASPQKSSSSGVGHVTAFASRQPLTGEHVIFAPIITGANDFYVQLGSEADTLQEVTDLLAKEYAKLSVLQNVRVGAPCAAEFTEDNAPYRAVIESINGSKAKILFVDFGNGEERVVGEIKGIGENLSSKPPPLALHCQIVNFDSATASDVNKKFVEMGLEIKEDLKATFLRYDKATNIYTVELSDTEIPSYSTHLGLVAKAAEPEPSAAVLPPPEASPAPQLLQYLPRQLAVGESKLCVVLNDEGPTHFTLQLVDESEKFDALALQLESYKADVIAQPKVGLPCVSEFEGAFYRGLITAENKETKQWHVFYVDYGNSEEKEAAALLQISGELLKTPILGLHCALAGVGPTGEDGEWSAAAVERFSTLLDTEGGPYAVTVVERNQAAKKFLVNVATEAAPEALFNDILVSEGTAKKSDGDILKEELPKFLPAKEMEIGSEAKECAMHYDTSPGDFFVLPIERAEQLDEITNALATFPLPGSEVFENPSVGVACIAPFEGAFYRARISAQLPENRFTVQFVDYGNTEDVAADEIYEIPTVLLATPPLAIGCALHGVEMWSEMKAAEFKELIGEAETLSVTFVARRDGKAESEIVYEVKLAVPGKDGLINDRIGESAADEEAVVTVTDATDEKTSDAADLEENGKASGTMSPVSEDNTTLYVTALSSPAGSGKSVNRDSDLRSPSYVSMAEVPESKAKDVGAAENKDDEELNDLNLDEILDAEDEGNVTPKARSGTPVVVGEITETAEADGHLDAKDIGGDEWHLDEALDVAVEDPNATRSSESSSEAVDESEKNTGVAEDDDDAVEPSADAEEAEAVEEFKDVKEDDGKKDVVTEQ